MEDQAQNNNNQQPLNPDLAGYPNVESLVAGYRNSSQEGKLQRERADKLEQLVTQQLLANAENQRRPVPDRRGTRPEDRLTEYGVPVDALEELIKERVQKAFEPITQGLHARGQIVSKHPDYIKFEQEVGRFIETDPEFSRVYANVYQADPAAAMEFAFLKFADSRRGALPGSSTNGGAREGMADASIPGGRVGDGRRAPDQDEAVRTAFERWRKTGSSADAAVYAKARLRSVITDDFLNQ